MKIIVPLFAVALTAVPAQAQSGQGQNGTWPVEAAGQACTMSQSFSDADFGRRTLTISYDAGRKEVSLVSINAPTSALPESGRLLWRIMFLDNGHEEQDDAWGARAFSYSREGEAYQFTTRFAGEKNVRQILADLAASRGMGFLAGPSDVVTAFDLAGARASIERLRACATRAVASN